MKRAQITSSDLLSAHSNQPSILSLLRTSNTLTVPVPATIATTTATAATTAKKRGNNKKSSSSSSTGILISKESKLDEDLLYGSGTTNNNNDDDIDWLSNELLPQPPTTTTVAPSSKSLASLMSSLSRVPLSHLHISQLNALPAAVSIEIINAIAWLKLHHHH